MSVAKVLAGIIIDEIVLARDLLLGIVQDVHRRSTDLARVVEVLSSTQFRNTGWWLFLVFVVFAFRPDTLCVFYPFLPPSASFVVVYILLEPFLRTLAFVRAFTESIIR